MHRENGNFDFSCLSSPQQFPLYSRTLRNQMLNIKNFLRFDSIICVGKTGKTTTTTTNEENQKKLNLIFHLTWSSRHSTYFQFVFFSQRNISPLFFHSSLSFDLLMSCRLSSKRNIAAKIFSFSFWTTYLSPLSTAFAPRVRQNPSRQLTAHGADRPSSSSSKVIMQMSEAIKNLYSISVSFMKKFLHKFFVPVFFGSASVLDWMINEYLSVGRWILSPFHFFFADLITFPLQIIAQYE